MIACNHSLIMASLTIRRLSDDTKERLRLRAVQSGCSLEALARTILDRAAEETASRPKGRTFPYNLIAELEPGEDIEPYIRARDYLQDPIEM